MNILRSIELLNSLLVINNDRIEGYKNASEETKDPDLKSLFAQFEQTSMKCRNELAAEIIRLDGTQDEGSRTTGNFFRVWMDLKVALSANDRVVILDSCEYGERMIVKRYEDILTTELEDLSFDQKELLHAQHEFLKKDKEKIKGLQALSEPIY